jgi:hypothetical protein
MSITRDNIHEVFSALGLPLRTTKNPNPPAAPDKPYPIFFLNLTTEQVDKLRERDGGDNSFNDENATIPTAGEFRRFLARLKKAELITSWHAFSNSGTIGVHIQLNREQADFWWSWIDWPNRTNGESEKNTLHGWI